MINFYTDNFYFENNRNNVKWEKSIVIMYNRLLQLVLMTLLERAFVQKKIVFYVSALFNLKRFSLMFKCDGFVNVFQVIELQE